MYLMYDNKVSILHLNTKTEARKEEERDQVKGRGGEEDGWSVFPFHPLNFPPLARVWVVSVHKFCLMTHSSDSLLCDSRLPIRLDIRQLSGRCEDTRRRTHTHTHSHTHTHTREGGRKETGGREGSVITLPQTTNYWRITGHRCSNRNSGPAPPPPV